MTICPIYKWIVTSISIIKYVLQRKRDGFCCGESRQLVDQMHFPLTPFHLHRRQHGSPSNKSLWKNLSYFGKCGNTKSVRRYLPRAEAKGGDGDEQQEPFEERVFCLFRSGCCGARLSPKGDELTWEFTTRKARWRRETRTLSDMYTA